VGVGDGGSPLLGKNGQEIDFFPGKRTDVLRIEAQDAEHFAFVHHRHGKNRADALRLFGVPVGQAPVGCGVPEIHVAVFEQLRTDLDGMRRTGVDVAFGKPHLRRRSILNVALRILVHEENDGRLGFEGLHRRGNVQLEHFLLIGGGAGFLAQFA